MFYVYEWYIVDTEEIIYVGKGTNSRYKVRKHNKLFNEMIKRFPCESRIIKEFESEQEAFAYEYAHINKLRQQGQCICNIREGGFGGSTEWWTDELRQQYSVNNVMHSKAQRERMSKDNPMKKKTVAQKVSQSNSRAVIIGETTYPSIKNAMESLNVTYETIALWCAKGRNSHNELCRFKDSEQVIPSEGRYNTRGAIPIVYKDKIYETEIDLAKELRVGTNTVCIWVKRGFDAQGNPCRKVGDTRQYVFENRHTIRNLNRAKSVIVNGVHYKSVLEASRELKVTKGYLYSILQGTRKSKKYICVYDNQQPSQTNSSKSSLEGSTTNE